MNKYISMIRISFYSSREHSFEFFGSFFIYPVSILLLYFVWEIIFSLTDKIGDFNFQGIIQYYIIVTLLVLLNKEFWSIHLEINSDINRGKLNNYLTKPMNYQNYLISRVSGNFFLNMLTMFPIMIVASILMNISIPNLIIFPFFIISILFSTLILFIIQFLIGIITFWTERIYSTRDLILNTLALFSGAIVPISLFPTELQQLSYLLPFQAIYFIPTAIYSTQFSLAYTINNILFQVFWIIILLIFSRLIFKKGLNKYDARGG